jgi:hypothetical protein
MSASHRKLAIQSGFSILSFRPLFDTVCSSSSLKRFTFNLVPLNHLQKYWPGVTVFSPLIVILGPPDFNRTASPHLNFGIARVVPFYGDPVRNRTGMAGLGNLSTIHLCYGV